MTRRLALALAAALAATPARAETVRAQATTLFYTRQVPYAGETQREAPILELVSVTASDIATRFAQEVEIAVSTWGAFDLGDTRRWQAGVTGAPRATGDVDVGYVKGELFDRRLILRLGRFTVAEGAARMAHLDGGQARLRLPGGFGVSGWAGSPVPARFGARGGEWVVGNDRADVATGGRASWFLAGVLEAGASVHVSRDRGTIAREDAGADLRLFLPRHVELSAAGFYAIPEARLGELVVEAAWRGGRDLEAKLDYRRVAPDLFLPRTSILSVFADVSRDDVGGALRLRPVRGLVVDADYHLLVEPGSDGHRGRLKALAHPRANADVGAEVEVLYHSDRAGYALARAFAAWRRTALELTADVLPVWLLREVNGERFDLSATATAGWRLAPGWKVLVAGTAGTTPWLSSHLDVLAKLVYDQLYVSREVR